MSSQANHYSPLDAVHLQCVWDDLLEGNNTYPSETSIDIAEVEAVFGDFFGFLLEGIACVAKVVCFIHHAWVSGARAWMVYIMVIGMMAITIMIYQKEHRYYDDDEKGMELARICDYLAFAVLLVFVAYFAHLVYFGTSTWGPQVVTELIILSGAFRFTKTVVCAPLTFEMPAHDLGDLPIPGYKPVEPLPRVITYSSHQARYD